LEDDNIKLINSIYNNDVTSVTINSHPKTSPSNQIQ